MTVKKLIVKYKNISKDGYVSLPINLIVKDLHKIEKQNKKVIKRRNKI